MILCCINSRFEINIEVCSTVFDILESLLLANGCNVISDCFLSVQFGVVTASMDRW